MQPVALTPTARVFKYEKPSVDETRPVALVKLARTDRMMAFVQIRREGGENNLHSHSHYDGLWMVLSGHVRFYTEANVLIADLGPREGVLIPRKYKYWFETVGPQELEMLQVEAFDEAISGDDVPQDPNDPGRFYTGYGDRPLLTNVTRLDGRIA
jgi:mannose-6-phosphate isomerase-like protein (cupin superfamily)